MKIEWLVSYVTAVGSPYIAERAILGVILAERCFGQFRLYLWSESYFCDVGTPSCLSSNT